MTLNLYKKLIDKLPQGVFVFDHQLRVKFTNAVFQRYFSDKAKKKGTLFQTLDCPEKVKCGQALNCRYCTIYQVMKLAVETQREQTETMTTTVRNGTHTNTLSLRVKVLPMDEKGKLFIGLTEGSYQTEMEREMLSAKLTQQRLLPAGKNIGGVKYQYMYIPCHGIGGDMTDVYECNGKTYGFIADVSGKGISAGILSAFVKAGFDRQEESLAKALSKLNMKFNELDQDERSYITVAGVSIDKKQKLIRYAVAGHNAPILLRNEVGIHEIEMPSPPISNWMPDFEYTEREFPYQAGDILALLTDGVTECQNLKGEAFGIERVENVLMQSHTAEDFIGKLKSALQVFSGGKFNDDITAIAFDL